MPELIDHPLGSLTFSNYCNSTVCFHFTSYRVTHIGVCVGLLLETFVPHSPLLPCISTRPHQDEVVWSGSVGQDKHGLVGIQKSQTLHSQAIVKSQHSMYFWCCAVGIWCITTQPSRWWRWWLSLDYRNNATLTVSAVSSPYLYQGHPCFLLLPNPPHSCCVSAIQVIVNSKQTPITMKAI